MTNKKIRQPIVTVCGHVDHGKCVSGDTIIPLIDGTLISAKELFEKNYDKSKAKKQGKDIIQKTDKLELLTNLNSKIFPAKISHIWKREKRQLIEIKTAHGDIIKTTPEHPYFVFSLGEDKKIKAEDLKEGDFIAIPSRIRIEDANPNQIIIDKLKDFNFLCFLDSDSILFEKIKKTGISKLEKKLSIKHLRDSLKNLRIRFQDLNKICNYFKISDIQMYNLVKEIKNSSEKQRAGHTSKRMKLPDFQNLEKFGYILGCIAGDGHLSKTQVLLDNNDEEIQERYSEYLKEVFNIECKLKQNHTCQTVVNDKGLTFKKFLKDIIGFPDKQKSANIEVPEIAQRNKEIFKGFFAGLIDTDGYVSKINNSIESTSKSRKLIKQCSILLLNFGVLSSVFEKNGFSYLRISNKEYLGKFLENFNLRLTRKLKRVIDSYEKSQSSRIFDILPLDKKKIKKLNLLSKPNKVIPYFNKYLKSQNVTRDFLKKVLEAVVKKNEIYNKISSKLEGEIRYVKVVNKKTLKNKEKYVYDFTVPQTHNFVAERTLLHNTSILDKLRQSSVQEHEAGQITQKISFTSLPLTHLEKAFPEISKIRKLKIPGFLLIDTPGHAAFTNLRKRGGSLADLAVLVIDTNEGIKPQTSEVIKLLKTNKIPFIIALNKIDNISGWKFNKNEKKSLKQNIESQNQRVKQVFDERYLTLVGSLNSYGFDADLFYNIKDFTKKIALIPCSAETGEGIQELMLMLCGISQKYLEDKLSSGKEAKGVVLEIKKEKEINYIEAILHDGELSKNDEIAISNLEGIPNISKIRILEEILPLKNKFKPVEKAKAATGLRMQLVEKIEITPGMPFVIYKENKEKLKEQFKKEISENINSFLSKQGIIIKADSLGSLEALLTILRENKISVVKAGIGKINKTDLISAKAAKEINEINSVIVGFNVSVDEEAKNLPEFHDEKIKVLTDDVIYKLVEDLLEFRKEKQKEIEKKRLLSLAPLNKIKILPDYVFRNTNPAIFGVRIEAGKLTADTNLIDNSEEKIGKIKNIQSENKSVEHATETMEVAISISNTNFERKLKNKQFLYSNISETQFRNFKKNKDLLNQKEIALLQEIAEIKRKKKPEWGL